MESNETAELHLSRRPIVRRGYPRTAMADLARLLDALSNLIGTVIWPALVLFLLLKFRTQLGAAVDDLRATISGREFTMKAGPGACQAG